MPPIPNLPGLLLDRTHPLTRGLVGWWPMNEAGGTRAGNVATPHRPGVGQSAMSHGGAIHGGAANLSASQYYTIPSAPELNLPAGGTLCFWGVLGQLPASGAAMWGFGKDYAGNRSYAFGASNNTVITSLTLQINGAVVLRADSGRALSTGRPYFFAAAGNSTTGWRGYLNGSPEVSAAWSAPASLPTTSVTIGRREYVSFEENWIGRLWNARVYNRALDAREVAQLYADPMAGAKPLTLVQRMYTLAFRAAWASRSNQIIGGGP